MTERPVTDEGVTVAGLPVGPERFFKAGKPGGRSGCRKDSSGSPRAVSRVAQLNAESDVSGLLSDSIKVRLPGSLSSGVFREVINSRIINSGLIPREREEVNKTHRRRASLEAVFPGF